MSAFTIVLEWLIIVALFQGVKPLPPGVNYEGNSYPASDSNLQFLADLTYLDNNDSLIQQQEIFDTLFACITSAREYILLDMFLINSFKGPSGWSYRDLSPELTRLLVKKKQDIPNIQIDVITDPVNIFYGGSQSLELESLKQAGVNVIITNLPRLRDSTPLYSPIWRTGFRWMGNTDRFGIVPQMFSAEADPVTVRSYLAFLNLKANHRKVFIADKNGQMISMVISANPHSASSDFSNIGILVKGDLARDLWYTEKQLARFSGTDLQVEIPHLSNSTPEMSLTGNRIKLITEGMIKEELLDQFSQAGKGDTIKMAMFYLSNRKIMSGLLQAADNGAVVRMILDPNKDGFGFRRNGVPNRPAAHELTRKSQGRIDIRWYHTHGEQFHSKLTMVKRADGTATLILGSANLTRKNLNNFNLETNICLDLVPGSGTGTEVDNYFDSLWYNRGAMLTKEYAYFADRGILKTLQYRIQEFSGLSTY